MLNRFFKTVFMSVIATASLANAQNSAIILKKRQLRRQDLSLS